MEAGRAAGEVSKFCEEQEFSSKQTMLLSLAIEEMLTIIIRQCEGQYTISVRMLFSNDNTVVIRIRNSGMKFNPIEFYMKNISEDIEKSIDIIGVKYVVDTAPVIYYRQTFGINNLIIII